MSDFRFYIDADILGLAKILVQVRDDVTFPGDPGTLLRAPCPVRETKTLDHVWIPIVASNGWMVITRDRHLLHRPEEIKAVQANKAKVVRLQAREQLNRWLQLEMVMTQWRRLEELVDLPGPFIYRVSRTTLVKEL